ncbi:uncharacterized protein Dmoj_GI11996 [Drosophila mojavensis]|uniref:FHA domain-containing protein n=1 Tax=Drosophila mojavensis TaxID=7230 RepID=B4KWY1_DROMO|nr:uncharacterized protein Dmoj_GI11996 [Drosophila mojavensis]
MAAQCSYWYLEHVSTGKKLILQSGDNLVGRHSCCKIVLKDYDFLSRQHAKFIINSENIVSVEQLNALNGIFINEIKLEVKIQSLTSGDRIGLGVQVESLDDVVPPNYAIFHLKQMCPNAADIVIISDEEDIDLTPPRIVPKIVNNNNGDASELQKPEVSNVEGSTDECTSNATTNRPIHLPKLPEVKQELLSQATKEIENIFGEPDEELLESVFQINPYVYKQLNNNNIAPSGGKIHDGDVIELPEEVNSPQLKENFQNPDMPPPKLPVASDKISKDDKIIVDDNEDDYDENFELSQAVLREMKEEMADSLHEDCDSEQEEEDFQPAAPWVKSEIATKIDDDEIIVIEDEDDELYSKVADWSSKLLTQNIMSQVYPLDDEKDLNDVNNEDNIKEDNNVEEQAVKLLNDNSCDTDTDNLTQHPILIRRRSKALRIESSEDESPDDSNIIDKSFRPQDEKDEENNMQELEVVLVPFASVPDNEIDTKKGKKKSTPRKRKKTVSERSQGNKGSVPLSSPTRSSAPEPKTPVASPTASSSADLKTPEKYRSPRMLNRSKSCYAEAATSSSLSIPVTYDKKEDKKTCGKLSDPRVSKTKCRPRSENRSESSLMDLPKSSTTKNLNELPESKLRPKECSPRMMNRSKSCLIENPTTSSNIPIADKISEAPTNENGNDATVKKPDSGLSVGMSIDRDCASVATRNVENPRGPTVIEAPHLPIYRGKLRGVSAISRKEERKNIILERQRSAEYQAEMKRKWYQIRQARKRECQENKEKRREQLKKLTDKPKPDETTERADARKRKLTNVPTPSNCNRGDFLTKDIQPPTTKKPRLEKVPAKPEKPTPKRRATIESFSQQLSAMDLIRNLPEPPSRPRVRKDAELARNQRTCNRVTFAEMDREFDLRQEREKRAKSSRHVRFNDNLQIKIIDRVPGANRKVGNFKDTKKITLSTYAERRAWSQAKGRLENFSDLIMGNILSWANQWLKLGSADAVAESEVLIPIPNEFKSYKQYKEIVIPLMKLELLTTIERDYKISSSTFEVNLKNISGSNSRNRPRYVLNTRYNSRIGKRFDLYTISSEDKLKETFASLPQVQRVAGNVYDLSFEILQEGINLDVLNSCKIFTVRPVVDNIRVEMGAFNAIYLMGRSPLFHRILHPSETVLSYDNKLVQQADYKGFKKLNDHQMDICQRTWSRLIDDSTPSVTLIQGPPGTGKSAVISNLTLQCMYGSSNISLDRKVLICAHSNAAVDNITAYLKKARSAMSHSHFELIRFGFFEKMDSTVRDVSLDAFLHKKLAEKRNRLSAENIEALKKHQQMLEKEIADIKKLPDQINYIQNQLDSKEKQLRLVMQQLKPQLTPREEHECSMMVLQRANIVCTTLSSCVKLANFIDYFDVCIIDEATQCTEPWTLLPLRFGVRGLVLVGDTQQLPATVLSQKAIEFGLGNSMFDRIQRNLKQQLDKPGGNHFVHTKIFKLSKQYRMHPEICKWPNSYFYDNQLVNAECTHKLISPFIPYCVINLSYTKDTNDASSRSISNDEEARFVAKLLLEMDKLMPVKHFHYGLISPYSSHCYTLSQLIPSHMKITPQTVDAFQGQERDVIILSNARTRGVGFLTNYQRLNVAITRPTRCLIICGNFDDLQSVNIWRHLLDDARKRNVYFDLERGDVEDLQKSLISKMLIKPIEIADNTPSSSK